MVLRRRDSEGKKGDSKAKQEFFSSLGRKLLFKLEYNHYIKDMDSLIDEKMWSIKSEKLLLTQNL